MGNTKIKQPGPKFRINLTFEQAIQKMVQAGSAKPRAKKKKK